jgi:hypothetical protein
MSSLALVESAELVGNQNQSLSTFSLDDVSRVGERLDVLEHRGLGI